MKLLVVAVLIAVLSVDKVKNNYKRSLCVSCACVCLLKSNKSIYLGYLSPRRSPESGGRNTEAQRVGGKAAHFLGHV